MKFHVAGLMQEPVGATRRFDVAEDIGRIDEQVGTVGPVTGHVKLTRTNTAILVDADLHVSVRLDCSRCLTEVTVPLDIRFKEQYQPTIDMATGVPLPAPEDRSVFTIDENHILDLSEAFRQYTLLALPMAPLCKAACAGLCPKCGHNLNEGPCECALPEVDARWEALAQYLKGEDAEAVRGAEDSTRMNGKRKRKK